MTHLRRYVVSLKRDTVFPAWIVQQQWPQGVVEGRHFYDDNKNDQWYHHYFEECCREAPKDYVLDDIEMTKDKGMIATYRKLVVLDA